MAIDQQQIIAGFSRVLRSGKSGSQEALAREVILGNLSYRLPNAAKTDPFVGFRILKRVWFAPKVDPSMLQGTKFILDSSERNQSLRTEYLERIGIQDLGFIARQSLVSYRATLSLTTRIRCALLGILWSIQCLFAENRANKALLYISLIELSVLATILPVQKQISIYDFNQFEVDSNLFYVVLKSILGDGLTYYKFPSPGPLYLHNSSILTDYLCYNSPYHLSEIKHIGGNMRYHKLMRVPAEQFFTYSKFYTSKASSNYDFDIAYYSHASWLRKFKGDAEHGMGILAFENRLLELVAAQLATNPELRIKIFTHPKERKEEFAQATLEYYSKFFQNLEQVTFVEKSERSSDLFRQAKIGVGVYSTILFERLACGCATLIMTPTQNFPIPSSPLVNLIVDESNFNERLKSSLDQSTTAFFDQNDLEDFIDPLLQIET